MSESGLRQLYLHVVGRALLKAPTTLVPLSEKDRLLAAASIGVVSDEDLLSLNRFAQIEGVYGAVSAGRSSRPAKSQLRVVVPTTSRRQQQLEPASDAVLTIVIVVVVVGSKSRFVGGVVGNVRRFVVRQAAANNENVGEERYK